MIKKLTYYRIYDKVKRRGKNQYINTKEDIYGKKSNKKKRSFW